MTENKEARLPVARAHTCCRHPSACWPALHCSPGATAVLGRFHLLSALTSSELPSRPASAPSQERGCLHTLWPKPSGAGSSPQWPSCLIWKNDRKPDKKSALHQHACSYGHATEAMLSLSGVRGAHAPEGPELGRQGTSIKQMPCSALEEGECSRWWPFFSQELTECSTSKQTKVIGDSEAIGSPCRACGKVIWGVRGLSEEKVHQPG